MFYLYYIWSIRSSDILQLVNALNVDAMLVTVVAVHQLFLHLSVLKLLGPKLIY